MNKISISIILAVVLACSCAPANRKTTPVPNLSQPVEAQYEPMDNPGSLFNPANSEFLFSDNRANRVGDIVLVEVTETTTAKNKADTKADKSNELNLGVENFATGTFLGAVPFVNQLSSKAGSTPLLKATTESNFNAKAETKRESNLSATVAARIVQVLPGNIYQVEGAREVRVNDDTQILVVRGLLRQRDIGPDNSVPSSYLAEARIELYGQGILQDKQRPGWLSRLLDHVWPF